MSQPSKSKLLDVLDLQFLRPLSPKSTSMSPGRARADATAATSSAIGNWRSASTFNISRPTLPVAPDHDHPIAHRKIPYLRCGGEVVPPPSFVNAVRREPRCVRGKTRIVLPQVDADLRPARRGGSGRDRAWFRTAPPRTLHFRDERGRIFEHDIVVGSCRGRSAAGRLILSGVGERVGFARIDFGHRSGARSPR